MDIFLSYAAEDRDLADEIQLALTGSGHKVFFDKKSLAPANDFHSAIRAAVERSDIFVFLISPESVTRRCYTLTELEYAKAKWPHPKSRVLPVLVREVSLDCVPSYLKAVNILEPEGNIPAEVLLAVARTLEDSRAGNFDLGVNLGWLKQGFAFGGRPISEIAADLGRVQRDANARHIGNDAAVLIATAQETLAAGQQPNNLPKIIDDLITLFQEKAEDLGAAALNLGIAMGRLHQGSRADNLPTQMAASCLEAARTHASKAQYYLYDGFIDNASTKLFSGQPISAIFPEVTHLMGLFQGQR